MKKKLIVYFLPRRSLAKAGSPGVLPCPAECGDALLIPGPRNRRFQNEPKSTPDDKIPAKYRPKPTKKFISNIP
jgi:hypothetical protein